MAMGRDEFSQFPVLYDCELLNLSGRSKPASAMAVGSDLLDFQSIESLPFRRRLRVNAVLKIRDQILLFL